MRLLAFCVFLVAAISSFSQTRIAPPAAKINLAELSSLDPKKKKDLKLSDRFKDKKTKLINKKLKKHTGLDRNELEGYRVMVRGLDSLQMEQLDEKLDQVIASQNETYARNRARVKKERKKAQEWNSQRKKYQKDSLSMDSREISSLAAYATTQVKDTITSYASDRYNVELDSLSKNSLNRSDLIGLASAASGVDSTYVENKISSQINLDTAHISEIRALSKSDSARESSYNQVEAFMESFAKERIKSQDLGLTESLEAEIPTVQHFIPELEKFDYQKPKIPEEKLTEALIQQQKEKQKDRLKESVLPKLSKGEDSMEKEVKWIEKWRIGGFVEYKPEGNLIELTPTLAYGIMEKLYIGVGYSTTIMLEKNDELDRQTAYRAFLDYLLVSSFYLHAESEWKQQQRMEQASLSERSTLLGLGRNFTYKSVSTSVLALYNLSAPNSIDARRFSVRFAVNFNP